MGRRRFTAEFKTKIVLEILREEKLLGELATEHGVAPINYETGKKNSWKTLQRCFRKANKRKILMPKKERWMKIGMNSWQRSVNSRLRMTGSKKNMDKCLGPTGRLNLVSKKDKLSVTRQCELLEINRTSVYYTPACLSLIHISEPTR